MQSYDEMLVHTSKCPSVPGPPCPTLRASSPLRPIHIFLGEFSMLFRRDFCIFFVNFPCYLMGILHFVSTFCQFYTLFNGNFAFFKFLSLFHVNQWPFAFFFQFYLLSNRKFAIILSFSHDIQWEFCNFHCLINEFWHSHDIQWEFCNFHCLINEFWHSGQMDGRTDGWTDSIPTVFYV